MTAREKFIARLKELGLYEEWDASGDMAAKFMDDKSIVIMVHYEWESDDPYHELHFPRFDELRDNEQFVKECRSNFFEHNDDKFVADLARWLEYGPCCRYECPLFPADAYFPANGLETEVIEFKDDDENVTAREAIQAIADKFGLSVSFD